MATTNARVILVAALIGLPLTVSAGTYDFTAASGLTGSITLAHGAHGNVTSSEILSFDFISGPGLDVGTVSGTHAVCDIQAPCELLSVVGRNLYFDPPFDIVGSENLDGYYAMLFENANQSVQNPQGNFFLTDDPFIQGAPFDYYGSDFLLATAVPVPEGDSASALLAGLLLMIITGALHWGWVYRGTAISH
jgi:hypothetical protein